MDIHLIIRPKNRRPINGVQRAGTIQFNKWKGDDLKAIGTATLWWKRHYIHARAETHHSVVTLEIPPNEISRLLHFGFSVEVLKNNVPIYQGEWKHNEAIGYGCAIRINLESIQLKGPEPRPDLRTVVVFPRQPGIHAISEHVTYHG